MSRDGRRSEEALVRRCLANDQDACTELVHQYQRMVHAIVWRTTREHRYVDDLIQETFMRVFCGLPHFGERSKLSTWIGTIASRVALDHKRASGKRRRAHERLFSWTDDGQAAGTNPERLLVQREATVIVREELNSLADRYRLPLAHVAIRERRYETVSQLLGIPLGTVKANVFYGKGLLRQRLQRRLQTGHSMKRCRGAINGPIA